MRKVKIPKLKAEEKEEIIKEYFRKKEGEIRVAEGITTSINLISLAFLAVGNILTAGLFFLVAAKIQSVFLGVLGISAICTSVLMSYTCVNYVKKGNELAKKRK